MNREGRGQMIMIGGVALAILFVMVAIILNSAIFAQYLATKSLDSTSNARDYNRDAVLTMENSIKVVHRNESHLSYNEMVVTLNDTMDNYSLMVIQSSALSGKYIDIDLKNRLTENGTRIAHEDGSTFEPASSLALDADSTISGATSWAAARDVEGMKGYKMEIHRSSLGEYNRSQVVGYIQDLSESTVGLDTPPFAVSYDVDSDGDPDHTYSIYRADGTDLDGDVNITYYNHSSMEDTTCRYYYPGDTFDVGFTEETLGTNRTVNISETSDPKIVPRWSQNCNEILSRHNEIENPYTMYYVRGSMVRGNYSFVVNSTVSEFKDEYSGLVDLVLGDYYHHTGADRDSPYIEPGIYAATFEFDYQSNQAEYRTNETAYSPPAL